jgi:hypothetical protein
MSSAKDAHTRGDRKLDGSIRTLCGKCNVSVAPTRRDMAVAVMDHTFHGARATIETFLRGSGLQTSGPAQFATLHLVTRSLGDLGWAQNAATAGFPIQAYSLMRPAWEAVNLCDLFARNPELAGEWAEGVFSKFAPAAVRRRLGHVDDPFYSFMSERSHPRFAGLQMTIFKVAAETSAGERQRAVLHLNDIPLEVTAAYMATATPGIILARLTAQAGRLNFEDPDHKPRNFASMIRNVSEALKAGWHAMDAGLEDDEREDPEARRPQNWAEEIGGLLDTLAGKVDEVYDAASGDTPRPRRRRRRPGTAAR